MGQPAEMDYSYVLTPKCRSKHPHMPVFNTTSVQSLPDRRVIKSPGYSFACPLAPLENHQRLDMGEIHCKYGLHRRVGRVSVHIYIDMLVEMVCRNILTVNRTVCVVPHDPCNLRSDDIRR